MTPDTGSPVSLWLREVRLPFLTASVIPVLVGAAVAWHDARLFNLPLFLLTLAGAVLAHAGANMANDYFDAKSGNDALNRYRSPFNGGAGVIQAGRLAPRQVHLGSLVCLAAAAGIGLYLSAVRGPGVLALMLTGGVAAYFYTANPIRFAYHGVGELLVGLSFGPLIVVGAHLVQTGAVSPAAVMASLPVGFLIMAVLYINQFPDFEADRAVGKRHWVVRLGTRRALPGLAVLLLAPTRRSPWRSPWRSPSAWRPGPRWRACSRSPWLSGPSASPCSTTTRRSPSGRPTPWSSAHTY